MLFIKCCRGTEQCHPSVSNQRGSWQRQLGCTRMHWHRPFKLADSEAWTWQWVLKLIYLLFAGKGYHFETHSKSFQFQDIEESNNATSILVWFLSRNPFTLSTNLIGCHFIPCHGDIFFFSFLISVFKNWILSQILFYFKHHLLFFLKCLWYRFTSLESPVRLSSKTRVCISLYSSVLCRQSHNALGIYKFSAILIKGTIECSMQFNKLILRFT